MCDQFVTFFNGYQMPLVGLGTWMADPEKIESAVEEALTAGYRLIDTAFIYGNEALIGNVLKRWLDEGKVQREELFIMTKLPWNGMEPDRVAYFLQKQLDALQLDYLDLYLIHTPWAAKYLQDDYTRGPYISEGKLDMDIESSLEATWAAMEEQVDAGLARSIGVCNVSPQQIERIMDVARIQPACVQVEISIYFQRMDVRETCDKYGIRVCGFSSLGSPGNKEIMSKFGLEFPFLGHLEDTVVVEIAEAKGKTAAQILLKFLLQQNIVVIPKSVNAERIRENIELFGWELTDEEMEKLFELERGMDGRVCWASNATNPGFDVHPEWHFPKVD